MISGITNGPLLFDPSLCLLADAVDDLEKVRIATENRLRMLLRTATDKDGEERGLGLDPESFEAKNAQLILDGLKELEKINTKALEKSMKLHPLNGWVQRNKGIGAKQAARLLAVIGDPYWNDLHNRPRTVSELWAYSGYSVNSGVAQRRTKGVKNNWSDVAKSRAFLMATSCIKSMTGEYRKIYDAARLTYAESVHPHDCVRCGPAGKPALAGSPLSLGHQHARALRKVSKEILKDLWVEARNIHHPELANASVEKLAA